LIVIIALFFSRIIKIFFLRIFYLNIYLIDFIFGITVFLL
jgi:hypothetical protein